MKGTARTYGFSEAWLRCPKGEAVALSDHDNLQIGLLLVENGEVRGRKHLPAVDVPAFLAKLARFTRRNLFLSTPDRSRSSHGTRTTAEWRTALADAGLRSVAVNSQWTTLFVCEPPGD